MADLLRHVISSLKLIIQRSLFTWGARKVRGSSGETQRATLFVLHSLPLYSVKALVVLKHLRAPICQWPSEWQSRDGVGHITLSRREDIKDICSVCENVFISRFGCAWSCCEEAQLSVWASWKGRFITESWTIPWPYHSVGLVLPPAFSLLLINEKARIPILGKTNAVVFFFVGDAADVHWRILTWMHRHRATVSCLKEVSFLFLSANFTPYQQRTIWNIHSTFHNQSRFVLSGEQNQI